MQFFFPETEVKKMTVPISMSEFPFILQKKHFLYNRFLKSKRVSLCHKRKLPSLIKFRKETEQKNKYRTEQYTQIKYACRVCKKMKTPLLTLNTGTWRSAASLLPAERRNQRDPRRFPTPDPALISEPLSEGQTVHQIGHLGTFQKG